MKKNLITLLCIILGIQSIAYSQTDTIRNRHKHYYYSAWYDSCYAAGNLAHEPAGVANPSHYLYAHHQYSEDTLEIIGIAVGVRSTEFVDSTRVPEYVFLMDGVADPRQYVFVDSARWDTATPKIMEIDLRWYEMVPVPVDTIDDVVIWDLVQDSVEYKRYIKICEAYFKSPIKVVDSFYLGRTNYNNILPHDDVPLHPTSDHYIHQETVYEDEISSPFCWHYHPDISFYNGGWGRAYYDQYNTNGEYPVIFPIIRVYDTFAVVGLSADSLQGYVEGSGSYLEERSATLTAVPHEGYKFVMWNDSVTANPRTFTVTADTTFTAYFAPLEEYSVEVYVDDLKRGTVQGSGVYYEQSEVTISAQANDGYYFQHWNDSVAANPRTIVLTQDTTFTAHFGVSNDSTVGISAAEANTNLFTLSPNPTTKNLQITLHQTGRYTMEIYSAKGVMLKQEAIGNAATVDVSALVPGTYVVKIYNESISGIRTFVKQ